MKKRGPASDLGALDLRARVAALETTNAHLASKVAELSFLASAAVKLGSTLDLQTMAHDVLEAAGTAADDRQRARFLLIRAGNSAAACSSTGATRSRSSHRTMTQSNDACVSASRCASRAMPSSRFRVTRTNRGSAVWSCSIPMTKGSATRSSGA